MFEPGKYEKRRHAGAPARPTAPYEPGPDIARMSLIVWGEHCIECAAPDCYRSCDLYERRPDTRCRRFAFGVYRNRNFPSSRGHGAEVVFKKWGKLEARGNSLTAPVGVVRLAESLIAGGAGLTKALGWMAAKVTRDERWNYLEHILLERLVPWLHRRRHRRPPDAFLLEVYNPKDQAVRMQLAIFVASTVLRREPEIARSVRPFLTTLTFEPGYNRHEIDVQLFRHVTEEGRAFDISLTPEADGGAHLVFLGADFVTFARARQEAKPEGPGVKCVVWDLDNTLWDGILLEGGAVTPNPRVVEIIKGLDDRGILNSIASKNDREHALAKLEELGLAEYFVYPQIHWMPKSEGVRQVARQLNVGIDTLAFVDDNPFELAEVAEAVPEVLCIPVGEVEAKVAGPRFVGSRTADARQRRQFYHDAMVRDDHRSEFGDDYLGFLAQCEIVLEVVPFQPEDSDRVVDLVQRTNQLNFSGTKYTRPQVEELLGREDLEKFVLRCRDRFGSYGMVGFSLVSRTGGEIRVVEFMLSCRVQGKFVETAFFRHLIETHGLPAAERLVVDYRPTARNTPALRVLEAIGLGPGPDGGPMTIQLTGEGLACNVVRLEPETSRAHVPSRT